MLPGVYNEYINAAHEVKLCIDVTYGYCYLYVLILLAQSHIGYLRYPICINSKYV